MNTMLILIAVVLGAVALLEGVIIAFLIRNRKDFAKKVRKQFADKNVIRREKGYLEKISDLYQEVERLEKQLDFYKSEVSRWKQKATEYAYAMQDIVELYSKACGTISNYLREGLLIKNMSDSASAYEHFSTTWRDLQSRRFIETYKFQSILDNPEELEYLFGTSNMNYLAEVFQIQ